MLVSFFPLSWPEWNLFASRNVGHPTIQRSPPTALRDGESEAGILYMHDYKAGE